MLKNTFPEKIDRVLVDRDMEEGLKILISYVLFCDSQKKKSLKYNIWYNLCDRCLKKCKRFLKSINIELCNKFFVILILLSYTGFITFLAFAQHSYNENNEIYLLIEILFVITFLLSCTILMFLDILLKISNQKEIIEINIRSILLSFVKKENPAYFSEEIRTKVGDLEKIILESKDSVFAKQDRVINEDFFIDKLGRLQEYTIYQITMQMKAIMSNDKQWRNFSYNIIGTFLGTIIVVIFLTNLSPEEKKFLNEISAAMPAIIGISAMTVINQFIIYINNTSSSIYLLCENMIELLDKAMWTKTKIARIKEWENIRKLIRKYSK